MSEPKKRLLFISTRFLFPTDSGGKIRSAQVLRGMTGRFFRVGLVSPAPVGWRERHSQDINAVSDDFFPLPPESSSVLRSQVRKALSVLSTLPVPVATDLRRSTREAIAKVIATFRPDVVVFDFPHSATLRPANLQIPSVIFTHNVESEIFRRHQSVAGNFLMRTLWGSQYRKMHEFEQKTLPTFDEIVAVSERDAEFFAREYGIDSAAVIPTGVDTEFFDYQPPPTTSRVVFTGSMDWLANQDGIVFFMDEVWPRVVQSAPEASMTVVGRSPPSSLVQRAKSLRLNWEFTGFVDDVRTYIHSASVFVIPLRVGGGTRLKVFEAMACGCPVVSTTIGVEGLPLEAERHYLLGDSPHEIADRIVELLKDPEKQARLSADARRLVEHRFSYQGAADEFAAICRRAANLTDGGEPVRLDNGR